MALAAGLLLLPFARYLVPEASAVRPKSAPAVAVYVKHGEVVTQWDGREPLAVRDGLRLEVAADGYSVVTVATATAGAPWKVVHSGAVDVNRRVLLPISLILDAPSTSEHLAVVFSSTPLALGAVDEAIRTGARTSTVWVTQLEIPVEATP